MSKTVTLRLDDETYSMFRSYAQSDNRSIANFIKTATLRFIQADEFVGDSEMTEILADEELLSDLEAGYEDIKAGRVTFV